MKTMFPLHIKIISLVHVCPSVKLCGMQWTAGLLSCCCMALRKLSEVALLVASSSARAPAGWGWLLGCKGERRGA